MERSERKVGRSDSTFAGSRARPREAEEVRVVLAAREDDADDLRRERDQLRRALEQQTQRLAAVEARARRQVEGLNELRLLLLDAHEQLALRDELVGVGSLGAQERALINFVIRTRPWRHRLKLRLGLVHA